MAGEVINEFKEIDGSDAFDRQIDSEGTAKSKAKKEGTRERPFNVGLFQEVTDISWPGGTFLLVGTQDLTDLEADKEGRLFPVFRSKGIAAVSEDGVGWIEINTNAAAEGITSATDFGDVGGPTSSFLLGIANGEREQASYLAGGFYKVHTPVASGYVQPTPIPAVWSSSDQGATWQDTGLSFIPPGGSTVFSDIVAMGYSPKTKLFYVSVVYIDTKGGALSYFHYSSSGDDGWGLIESGPTLNLPYPEHTRTVGNVTGNQLKYAQVSSSGRQMTFADSDGEQHTLSIVGNDVAIDGVGTGAPVAFVTSATVGRGHIIAVGSDNNGNEKYLHRPIDENAWESIPQLQGFTVSPPAGGANTFQSTVVFS